MSIIAAALSILIRLHGHPIVGDGLKKIERTAIKAMLRHLQSGHANFRSGSGSRVG